MSNDLHTTITIRNLVSVEDLEKVRQLESLVWSFDESVPVNQTVAVVKNGGFILGAFIGDELIGFQYSFPGFDGKQIYLCSHSLGIHPNYRKFGIGYKLKIAQKNLALQKGYELITWTYDPLETVNGNLNLHKLGASCSTYLKNVYGDMDDELNTGIPTDRFLVEWWIKDDRKIKNQPETVLFAITTSEMNGYPVPEQVDLNILEDQVWVPVPSQFQELKKADFSLAVKWRETTSTVFTHYFSKGWMAVDLIKDTQRQNQYLYLLEKR